ncbi:MAG: 50S ribosomal protein L9 [Candidatus Omnitrophota bacterium]|jgi:large subunit ribosomal protein L9
MELILLNDVTNVGRKGDVVKVSDGYARNFLFPRKLAMASTRTNQKFVEEQRTRSAERKAKEKQKAQIRAGELGKLNLVIPAKTGEKGKLFGSVTSEHVAEALKLQGFETDKKHVLLKEHIRLIGSYTVPVEIYPGVKASVSVEVVEEQTQP